MTTRKLLERAENEGYALIQTSPEHAEKLKAISARILMGLDDINCWDGFACLLRMTTLVAVLGARTKVDSLQIMHRETFLKNCAEWYDEMARIRDETVAGVNADGGDA